MILSYYVNRKHYHINRINSLGQTLQSFESKGNEKLNITLKNAAGIYFIRLMNNNGTAQLPIIVK